jgi:hypothetical protein
MKRVVIAVCLLGAMSACSDPEVKDQLVIAEDTDTSDIYQKYREGEIGPDGMYRTEDGKFMVHFPGKPEYSTEVLDTDAGNVRVDMYVYTESATQSFMVSISEFPSKHVKKMGAEDMLQNAFNGALKPLQTDDLSILDDRNYTVSGMPAKRLKAKSSEWNVSAQMFIAGNRLYQVTILRDGALPEERVERKFMESFHIIERVE